jgi:hypothetical protein
VIGTNRRDLRLVVVRATDTPTCSSSTAPTACTSRWTSASRPAG